LRQITNVNSGAYILPETTGTSGIVPDPDGRTLANERRGPSTPAREWARLPSPHPAPARHNPDRQQHAPVEPRHLASCFGDRPQAGEERLAGGSRRAVLAWLVAGLSLAAFVKPAGEAAK
jgi:hypothetical protein